MEVEAEGLKDHSALCSTSSKPCLQHQHPQLALDKRNGIKRIEKLKNKFKLFFIFSFLNSYLLI